jgi:hypothetical protein
MAEQKKPPIAQQPVQAAQSKKTLPVKPAKRSIFLRLLLILFILVMLLGVGLAAGVYLNLIDLQQIAQTYKLYDYPVLSKYFSKPVTNFETVEIEQDEPTSQQPQQEQPPAVTPIQPPAPSPNKEAETVDLEKQIKLRQQEELKKITKLARLYSNMKPEEAVPIMNQLDDEIVIAIFSRMEEEQAAKILALMDAKRAARISQEMIKVKPVSTQL